MIWDLFLLFVTSLIVKTKGEKEKTKVVVFLGFKTSIEVVSLL